MIRDIELVTLLQTLVAAGQGSFHKAGTLVGVPASTVSRRVRSLEALIGIKLFDRHRHGIRPTAAGDAFLEQIRRILDELNIALINASTNAQGRAGWLKIGTYVSPSTGHLRAAIREYKRRFPDVDVQYTDGERRHLMERLSAGAIDVAIVVGQFRTGVHDVIPLWREKVLVAVPESHSLASKANVTWEDLRKEKIRLGRDPGPELRDHLISKLNASGDIPSIIRSDVGRDFALSLVNLEPEITLLYEADAGARHPGVIYREVTEDKGPSLVPYYACWLGANDNPALLHFLDLLRRQEGAHCRV
jgi:DNA-binding transcriptional LysR family regulator